MSMVKILKQDDIHEHAPINLYIFWYPILRPKTFSQHLKLSNTYYIILSPQLLQLFQIHRFPGGIHRIWGSLLQVEHHLHTKLLFSAVDLELTMAPFHHK